MKENVAATKNKDLAEKIGSMAVQAMIYEVSCFPAPGLVSPVSTGAHQDMNYYTFIDSACALSRYFVLFTEQGLAGYSEAELFKRIRTLGISAEKAMFAKTKGVNTHKGMLFLLGICCAAVGKVIYERKEFNAIPQTIRVMTAGLVKSELTNTTLAKKENLSYGEKIFMKYGVLGIRDEVEKGIPTVFDYALKYYENSNELSTNDRLVHTLIGIMQICQDTNIIHRHSLETLKEVQTKAKAIVISGGMNTRQGRKMIEDLNEEFVRKNISPGGSADLLGITVFMSFVKEELLEFQKML